MYQYTSVPVYQCSMLTALQPTPVYPAACWVGRCNIPSTLQQQPPKYDTTQTNYNYWKTVKPNHSAPVWRFYVEGPRKKVNFKMWIFVVIEMSKIIRQFDDHGHFFFKLNCLGVLGSIEKKYSKITVKRK